MSTIEQPQSFAESCLRLGVDFVVGVPDSLLSPVLDEFSEKYRGDTFVVAASEGAAVGLAIGHQLSGGSLSLVYLQNSGLGNAINPLVALADPSIYSIPMILLVGWRGELMPNGSQGRDEPQHLVQGKITLRQLDLLEIPHIVVGAAHEAVAAVEVLARLAEDRSGPVAIVVRAGTFGTKSKSETVGQLLPMSREEYVESTVEMICDLKKVDVPIVATTGMLSRELWETRLRYRKESASSSDFLTIGGMGHAISIAASIARNHFPRKVLCLDGDGSLLMHTGSLLYAARQKNLIHVVIDNGVHDSVGGQATGFRSVDAGKLSEAFGYAGYSEVATREEYEIALRQALDNEGSYFIRAYCYPGARGNLGRPRTTPIEEKNSFMRFFREAQSNE